MLVIPPRTPTSLHPSTAREGGRDAWAPGRCALRACLPQALCEVLGPSHRISRLLARLAADNMSVAARREADVRRIQLTTQMLGGPSPAKLAMAGGVSGPTGQDMVPVPERLWAVRNVANNMLRFGNPAQVGQDLQYRGSAAHRPLNACMHFHHHIFILSSLRLCARQACGLRYDHNANACGLPVR